MGSLISLCVFILMFIAAYQIAYHETEEILDQKLKSMAELLAEHNHELMVSEFNPHKKYSEENVFVDIRLKKDIATRQQDFPILSKVQDKSGYYYYQNANIQFIAYVIPLEDRQIQVAQPLSVRKVLSFELAGTMLIPYLLLLPIVFFLLYWGVGRGLQPIHRLKIEFAQRQYYDLSHLHLEDYPDELNEIVEEANYLFKRIEQAQHEQNEFIVYAAHELRSPLTALNLQAKMLERLYPESNTIPKLTQGIRRLQHLIQQLLDLARQGETEHVQAEKFSVQQLLKQVGQDLYPLVNEKNIEMALHAPEQDIMVYLDKHSLYLVCRNLLDNAIKYTPENGTIEISILQQEQFLKISIEDSGIGIGEDEYEKIMQKFYRVHNIGIGSGLGLAIVQKSLLRLNGEILFSQSQSLKGLKVYVLLKSVL